MGVGPKPPPTDFVGIKPTRRPNSGDYAVVTPYAMSTSCLPGPLGLACGGVSESEGLSHRFTGGRACPVNVDLRCPVSTCTGGTRRSRAHADNGLLDALGPFSQCCRRAGVPRSDQPRAAGSRCTQMPLGLVRQLLTFVFSEQRDGSCSSSRRESDAARGVPSPAAHR